MRIELPLSYHVEGIEIGRRKPASYSFHEMTAFDVPEVEASDLREVLRVSSSDGRAAETFYHFDDGFWIRDRRGIVKDLSDGVSPQHLMLLGHWPHKATRTSLSGRPIPSQSGDTVTGEQAEKRNDDMLRALNVTGILAKHAAQIGLSYFWHAEGVPNAPLTITPSGVRCQKADPRDRLRQIESSDRERRVAAVEDHIAQSVISVDGVLLHRVPTPEIYITDRKVDWWFTDSFVYRGMYDEARDDTPLKARKLPMTEHAAAFEATTRGQGALEAAFEIDFIDPSAFRPKDIRPVLAADLRGVLGDTSDFTRMNTAYVHQWCVLRDFVQGFGTSIETQEERTLDIAAEMMAELSRLADRDAPSGVTIWLNRSVAPTFRAPPPAPMRP